MSWDSVDHDLLTAMVDEMQASSALYRPGNVWSHLTNPVLKQVRKNGIANFKRDLNLYYAAEGDHSDELACHFAWTPPADMHTLRRADGVDPQDIPYTVMLWDYVRQTCPDAAQALSEPLQGNPLWVEHDGKPVTRDLAKSVWEYTTMRAALPETVDDNTVIAEVACGYGRLAHAFGTLTKARYFCFDIPPALLLAQNYITALFGAETVAPFRRYHSLEEVKQATAGKQFAFFTPNQLELFAAEGGWFDLVLNVDSFGEMSADIVKNYILQMTRASKRGKARFYSRNALDLLNTSDGSLVQALTKHGRQQWVVPSFATYLPPPPWQLRLFRVLPSNGKYFECLFDL